MTSFKNVHRDFEPWALVHAPSVETYIRHVSLVILVKISSPMFIDCGSQFVFIVVSSLKRNFWQDSS